MTEQAKVPAIRFAGFTDPWEQRKLGELSSEFQSGDFISAEEILGSGPYPVYGGNGLRGYAKQYNHDGFYALIGRQGALCGNVNTAVGKAYFTEHAVAVKANFLHDTRFLAHLLGCMDLGRYSGQSAQPGLAVGVLKEVETTVPSKAEQQAIGSFFSRLDSLITLHQRKYDKLVIFKKSMLEKMFPKDGESVPEIRFAGFTDPWEQRKLGEIVSIGAGAPPSAFSAGNFLYVKVDDLNESSHFQFDSAQRVDANTAVKPIRKGSIIFAKRGAAILGNKVRVLGKTAYIDTNMMALEPRGVDADFLWLFINQTGLYRIADTSTIPQINNKHIEPYPVDIPNMAEQQAIGTFFSRLDDLITLHQRKLELLQDIKKSLLDKMFV